ncbi:S1 family peptidase [Paenibacillus glycinis]|uniref:Trypsin-like serine protease n=1 Tax=Paenibacillus glycinis TaxID=2697035 RepID=A0ABW9XXN5_9BACL|nr:serine protease [Paenibacillus glycinis]NBD27276.1 trypsin-like serine protease [Paenibacillus glycinis]
MIRKLLALLLSVALGVAAGAFANAQASRSAYADAPAVYDAQEIYARSQAAVFYVRSLGAGGALKDTGTGVVLSADGLAATAYHVIAGADRIEAVLSDGRTLAGIKVLASDEGSDAAILQLPKPRTGTAYAAIELRAEPADHGEVAFAIGYPLKATPIITEGIVNSPAALVNGRTVVLASAQVVSGMSGGPLLDEGGRMIGVLSGSLRTMEGIHLAVEAADIRKLLPKA